MCTKKKAQEITNLLKDGENLKDTTSKFKEFIDKYKIADKMDILDDLHRKMPNVREKYLQEIKDLMDSGKSEAEIAESLSKYDKTFSELESLSKKERRNIRELASTATFEDVANTVDDMIKNSEVDTVAKEAGEVNQAHNLTAKDVPSVRNGEFNKWFDELDCDVLAEVWANPKLKKVKN